jgi:hypothetical protein
MAKSGLSTRVKMLDAGMGVSIAGVMAAAAMKVHYGRMLTLVSGGIEVDISTEHKQNKVYLSFGQDVKEDDEPTNPDNYKVTLRREDEAGQLGDVETLGVEKVERLDDREFVLLLEGHENLVNAQDYTEVGGTIVKVVKVVKGDFQVEPKNLQSKFNLEYNNDPELGGGAVGGRTVPIKESPRIKQTENKTENPATNSTLVIKVTFTQSIFNASDKKVPVVASDFGIAITSSENVSGTFEMELAERKDSAMFTVNLNQPLTDGTLTVKPVAGKIMGPTELKMKPEEQDQALSSVNLAIES